MRKYDAGQRVLGSYRGAYSSTTYRVQTLISRSRGDTLIFLVVQMRNLKHMACEGLTHVPPLVARTAEIPAQSGFPLHTTLMTT